jgi:kumamolisin
MKSLGAYKAVRGSSHIIPTEHKRLRATSATEKIMVTLILRRRTDGKKLLETKDFPAKAKALREALDRDRFLAEHGADPAEIEQLATFAKSNGLKVVETNLAARSLVLLGSAAKMNKSFQVKLADYQGPLGKYHSHTGEARLPGALAKTVTAVIGLQNRPIHAQAHNTMRRGGPMDPPNTKSVTPQMIAQLYDFPPGDGARQTIGIYEMATVDPDTNKLVYAGYTAQDVKNTMQGFGGGLKIPVIVDVPIDGRQNSGINDGETLLDITVAGAIAQGATIAVYFAGPETQNMLHALQKMIHPSLGDPVPTVISISYGWGPDDDQTGFSENEFTEFGRLFQDAANLFISVFISSGDNGCYIPTRQGSTVAQASYPATEPMAIACGGTTVGNVKGSTFEEYGWNDVGVGGGRPGASGGGISARFPVPSYQKGAGVPVHNSTKKPGRGIPDLAGNGSENSGYMQHAAGFRAQQVGGTSAVAPLYAGLFARINANLGVSVGFVNPVLYNVAKTAFRDVVAPPGPANNSFHGVTGYPVVAGWDAVTGLGSVKGAPLQSALKGAKAGSKAPSSLSHAEDLRLNFDPRRPQARFQSDLSAKAKADVGSRVAQQVPWPAHSAPAPKPLSPAPKETDGLSRFAGYDAIVMTYTSAEADTLATLFTPGHPLSSWYEYRHNIDDYIPLVTGRDAPFNTVKDARYYHSLGLYFPCTIGKARVLLFKSGLHLDHDLETVTPKTVMPFSKLLVELMQAVKPTLFITTGTGGGIGSDVKLGDVVIAGKARFDCRFQFKSEPWRVKAYKTSSLPAGALASITPALLDVNGTRIAQATPIPGRARPKVWSGPATTIVTTDKYAYDTADNQPYELQGLGQACDMGDAMVGQVMSKIQGVSWFAIRNASDPQMPVPPGQGFKTVDSESNYIYATYGAITSAASVVASWAIISSTFK